MAGAFHKGVVPQCVRCLELHEKGVENDAIAQRIGISRRSVTTMIREGKRRRAELATAEPAMASHD